MVYSEPLMSTFNPSPEVFPESVRYVEVVSAVVSSLKEDAAYENHEQGHTWKFTYGTAEVFVHLSGESPEDTLLGQRHSPKAQSLSPGPNHRRKR